MYASFASSIHIISIIHTHTHIYIYILFSASTTFRNYEQLQEMLPVRFIGDSGAGMCQFQEGSVVESAFFLHVALL